MVSPDCPCHRRRWPALHHLTRRLPSRPFLGMSLGMRHGRTQTQAQDGSMAEAMGGLGAHQRLRRCTSHAISPSADGLQLSCLL